MIERGGCRTGWMREWEEGERKEGGLMDAGVG